MNLIDRLNSLERKFDIDVVRAEVSTFLSQQTSGREDEYVRELMVSQIDNLKTYHITGEFDRLLHDDEKKKEIRTVQDAFSLAYVTNVFQDTIGITPHFHGPGVQFYDIFDLTRKDWGTRSIKNALKFMLDTAGLDLEGKKVVGLDARGFIPSTLIADAYEIGQIPIRKAGKLPGEVEGTKAEIEYAVRDLEIQLNEDLVGTDVILADDVSATGGSILASVYLCKLAGANVTDIVLMSDINAIALDEIKKEYPDVNIYTLMQFSEKMNVVYDNGEGYRGPMVLAAAQDPKVEVSKGAQDITEGLVPLQAKHVGGNSAIVEHMPGNTWETFNFDPDKFVVYEVNSEENRGVVNAAYFKQTDGIYKISFEKPIEVSSKDLISNAIGLTIDQLH
ncbi:hypothetical protein HN451_03325 [archaeon]|nr:hypothetical protein [archaeon]